MSDNKDNAPEKIWYCNMCGGASEVESNCHDDCYNGYDKNKHEYILKETADKELMQVMGDGAGVYIDRQIKETVEEILKPIKEMRQRFDARALCKAIDETLRIARKLK
jgi:hypothetical protein